MTSLRREPVIPSRASPARRRPAGAVAALALLATSGAWADDVVTAAPKRSLKPPTEGTRSVSLHDPFETADCGACHTSPSHTDPGPVKDTSNALCLECHDDPAPDAPHVHGGADGRCLDCHNPHASMTETLLHEPVATLCSGCHTGVAPRGKRRHEAIGKKGSCIECHAPHGGDRPKLIAAAFPPTLYARYAREAYALCFNCHDPSLVEAARTTTATKFRDGDRNLHTVHVMRDKGRSCRACHDAHAAKGPALVHDSVAYGSHGWRLPLSFSPREDGGGCARTCHVERRYMR